MASITTTQKGITLIELLVYMSIFSIIFLMITSSVFYMQKIIQHNNQDFYIKNQIYVNFNMLQQYLSRAHLKIENNIISLYDAKNNLIFTQKLEAGQLQNIYKNKRFETFQNIKLLTYSATTTENGTLLKMEIRYLDTRQKIQDLTEYLIVANRNS